MSDSRVVVAFAVAAFAWACGCSGAGSASKDVPLEISFSHDVPDAAADPGPGDVPGTDEADVPADLAPGDEGVADPGAPDVAPADETAAPIDPGPDDTTIPDPGVVDPGIADPGVEDAVVPYSKKPGQYCAVDQECANGALCVGSEVTHPQCNPGCALDADCDAVAINANGQCTEVEGFPIKVCLWLCGIMGGICPGDGQCDQAACR